MAVAGVNVGVGGFAAADALEPIANVGYGHVVGTGVYCGAGGCGGFCERDGGKKVRFHLHFGG